MSTEQPEHQRTLLIVEDDAAFARTLGRSFERRGYQVRHADSLDVLREVLSEQTPDYAVVDLKLKGGASGLACVQALREHDPETLIVVLTGYASIATAVDAIKLGADNYLQKPAGTTAILNALNEERRSPAVESIDPIKAPSLERMTWEHIQQALKENDGNISATARQLGMHRRTLQRKLQKRPVKS